MTIHNQMFYTIHCMAQKYHFFLATLNTWMNDEVKETGFRQINA